MARNVAKNETVETMPYSEKRKKIKELEMQVDGDEKRILEVMRPVLSAHDVFDGLSGLDDKQLVELAEMVATDIKLRVKEVEPKQDESHAKKRKKKPKNKSGDDGSTPSKNAESETSKKESETCKPGNDGSDLTENDAPNTAVSETEDGGKTQNCDGSDLTKTVQSESEYGGYHQHDDDSDLTENTAPGASENGIPF